MNETMGRISAALAHLADVVAATLDQLTRLAPALDLVGTGRRHGAAPRRQALTVMRIDRDGMRTFGYTRAP